MYTYIYIYIHIYIYTYIYTYTYGGFLTSGYPQIIHITIQILARWASPGTPAPERHAVRYPAQQRGDTVHR